MSTTVTRLRVGSARGGNGLFVLLAGVHGAIVFLVPTAATIALGLWWNSNTISHNFIHRPFFRRPAVNVLFSLYLSALLGIPQSLWRQRHLAHHAGCAPRLELHSLLVAETLLVFVVWGTLLAVAPSFWLTVYLPGFVAGLTLCALHGHYEHKSGTTSHYGRLYNLLFFNDGYHAEHHASPGRHWRRLPEHIEAGRSPAAGPRSFAGWRCFHSTLGVSIGWSASCCVHVGCNASSSHDMRAVGRLRRRIGPVRRVAIVGGGLFPRTALVARQVLPEAELVLIDANARNLRIASEFLNRRIETVHAWYDPSRHAGFDLVIIPLAYIGNRTELYAQPPAAKLMVHDWLWRRRGTSTIVSLLLLKRLNLVER